MRKAGEGSTVRLLEDVSSEIWDCLIPKGTEGVVVGYDDNPEGYAVDVAIPNDQLVGSFEYYYIILFPAQFEVLE